MSQTTSIEWTDATWNPVTGCSKVSPGCANCYAESYTERMAGQPGWIAEHRPWTPANVEHNVRLHPDRLDTPLRWRKPRMVFVNSMSDLFHEQAPDWYIAQVFAVMAEARTHTFQVLTKRPERMRELLRRTEFVEMVEATLYEPYAAMPWPLPNVWLGVSIENRRFVHRADLLRQTPAAVRFVSAEPLLGPLVSREPCANGPNCDPCEYEGGSEMSWSINLDGIDWLIAGGESGPRHRRLDLQWVRDLRDACRESGTAFFMKQTGGARPGTKLEDLPPDLRIREFPVRAA